MEMKKASKIGLITIAVIFVILILHYTTVLRPIENLLSAVFKPVQAKVYSWSQGLNDFYSTRKSKSALEDENEKLKSELISVQINESRLKELEEQNDFLRRQLEFLNENELGGIAANVIGRSQDSFQSFIMIDKGEKHGLKEGFAVTDQDVIVGKVEKAFKYTSRILLINDSFSKVAVTIQNNDRSIGILSGEYGLGLRIDLIPQTEEIIEGDYIITSGLEGNIPRGLFVGEIDNVLYTEGELFQTAFVKNPINFNKINLVSVLIPPYGEENN